MKLNTITDIKQLFKLEGPKLMPFFICVILYFAFVRDPNGELWTTVMKCAPIVCLMFYTVLNGFNLTTDSRYSKLILLALIFSCGGDVLLNIDLFPYGMGLFACAQLFYICAFGHVPVNWTIAGPLYLAGAAFVVTIFKHLDQVLSIGLPIYVTLLLTMCSCSLARAIENKCFLNTLRAAGSVLFVISDGLIGIDMFLIRLSNARIWIMLTYYLAQIAITFSVANGGIQKKNFKSFKMKS